MPKFTEALDRAAENIQRPPNLPVGDYILQISKMPENTQLNADYSKITHVCKVVEATDTVDPDDLEEFGNPVGQVVTKDFIFDEREEGEVNFERSLSDLKNFYEHCGIDVEKGSPKEWMSEANGMSFMGNLRHDPDKNDAEIIYVRIGKTAPVE
jgi:hypothetical protein